MLKTISQSTRYKRFKQFLWDIIVNSILSSFLCPIFVRTFFLRLFGIKIGKSTRIHGNYYIGSKSFGIGENSYLNRRCLLDNENGAKIEIGNGCAIGYNVSFLTTNHDFSNPIKRGGNPVCAGIKVGNGCWIGANVTVLPGVIIDDGCIIAAGAVVTKNCETNTIYAGVPAVKKKEINSLK
jgi:maltose O-acetyltransferase